MTDGWLGLVNQANMTNAPMLAILIRFTIDLAAMALLIFGMYYRRYRDKELVTAASLFNVFVFSVLTVLSLIEFGVAAGFGLFAILALFTLRSEPLSKVEMTYFFGSVAIAVITAVSGTQLHLVLGIVTLVLFGAYVMDHATILQSVDRVRVTLDQIDRESLTNPMAVRKTLSKRLGVEVMSYQIRQIDYVNEVVRLDVFYRVQFEPTEVVETTGPGSTRGTRPLAPAASVEIVNLDQWLHAPIFRWGQAVGVVAKWGRPA